MILIPEMTEFNNNNDDCRNICVAFTINRTLLAHFYWHFIKIQANGALMRTVLHIQLYQYNVKWRMSDELFSWIMEFQSRQFYRERKGENSKLHMKLNQKSHQTHIHTHTVSTSFSSFSIVRLIYHADQELYDCMMRSNDDQQSTMHSDGCWLLDEIYNLHKSSIK